MYSTSNLFGKIGNFFSKVAFLHFFKRFPLHSLVFFVFSLLKHRKPGRCPGFQILFAYCVTRLSTPVKVSS